VESHKQLADRALVLASVPLAALAVPTPRAASEGSRQRPQRQRYRPLETWRNERVSYSRPEGSLTPTVSALQLNMSPRPDGTPSRDLGCAALQVPEQSSESTGAVEFVGLAVPGVFESRVFTLPARPARQRPYTVALRPARGILHVLEGSVRCEGELGEVELSAGDTAVLRGSLSEALVAPSSATAAARLRWVLLVRPPVAPAEGHAPLQDASPALTSGSGALVAAAA